jgi:hypothetical protein
MNPYSQQILSLLRPDDERDWVGPGQVLALYDRTLGPSRDEFIAGIRDVVRERLAPVGVLAQVVDIITSLDITQADPEIVMLSADSICKEQPLNRAVANYFAFRELKTDLPVAMPQQLEQTF